MILYKKTDDIVTLRRMIVLELDDTVETLQKLHKKFVRYIRKVYCQYFFNRV